MTAGPSALLTPPFRAGFAAQKIKGSLADPGSRHAAMGSLHAYFLRDLPSHSLENPFFQTYVVAENKLLKKNIRYFFSQMSEHSSPEREELSQFFIERNLSALQSQADRIVHIWRSDSDDCSIL